MINQSQPLTLKLSNGQEVSIEEAKSVLRHTDNGQQLSCVIVRGSKGAAIYNAEGDVQINGAPSSAHWLQAGDRLEFGDISASVEQLGVLDQSIESLLNDAQPAAEAPVQAISARATAPTIAFDPDTGPNFFKPATSAASFTPEPVPELVPEPEPEQFATPNIPLEPETSPDLLETAAEFAIPAAATSALASAGILLDAGSTEPDDAPVTPNESIGFTLPAPAPTAPEPESVPPTTGFAAELLARIQADDNEQNNENETVGSPISETTHSPLAADGPSFSSPESDSVSISSLIPELPPTSVPAEVDQQEDQLESSQTAAPAPVETSTAESSERQAQSSSVSALLERMKSEGQWGGLSEEATEEATTPAAPEVQETPVLDEADEDVQSYMSQLLSRMRDPNEESPARPVAASVETPKPAEPEPEVVEAPAPVGLLKPEEYIPKNKACRLDSLQDMRALANTQTRTAINRSQAKRREENIGTLNIVIAVVSFVVASIVFVLNAFGFLSFPVALISAAVIATICGAFFCCKNFFSELLESKKNGKPATPHQAAQEAAPQEAAQEAV